MLDGRLIDPEDTLILKKKEHSMSEKFTTEKDGQIDFYNQFLPRINPNITVDEIIANNNDGVLNGNLIEFKLSVKDLNEVLFQCVKYLLCV